LTTYVIRDGALVEKPKALPSGGAFSYAPDIAEFRTTDGVNIGSRSSLRAYEQRHGVRQIGDMAKPVGRRDD
jgi:hypothetical protein